MPIWKKCHKTICSIEIFRFLTFPLLSFKIPISASVLPVFWAFPVLGPIITSLTIVREAIMMGPWTGNAQKTGKTRRKWVFFNSTMEIARNLKISMLQLAISNYCMEKSIVITVVTIFLLWFLQSGKNTVLHVYKSTLNSMFNGSVDNGFFTFMNVCQWWYLYSNGIFRKWKKLIDSSRMYFCVGQCHIHNNVHKNQAAKPPST